MFVTVASESAVIVPVMCPYAETPSIKKEKTMIWPPAEVERGVGRAGPLSIRRRLGTLTWQREEGARRSPETREDVLDMKHLEIPCPADFDNRSEPDRRSPLSFILTESDPYLQIGFR